MKRVMTARMATRAWRQYWKRWPRSVQGRKFARGVDEACAPLIARLRELLGEAHGREVRELFEPL